MTSINQGLGENIIVLYKYKARSVVIMHQQNTVDDYIKRIVIRDLLTID